jgi:sugar phosphate permease
MTQKVVSPRAGRPFYGWISLAGACMTAFVGGGVFFYGYGVFLPEMCTKLDWSRTALSTGLSLGLLAFGLLSPLYGALVDRFGPRANLAIGNMLVGILMAGMSLVQEVWHVYILYGLIGVAAGIGGYIASAAVANNWFRKKLPLAMGIFGAATVLGGFVFPPLITVLISSLGWRISWVVVGGMVLVFAGLVGGLIMARNKPEDMGQVPDGISAEPYNTVDVTDNTPDAGEGAGEWTVRKALREPATWLITVFSAAAYFALATMIGHQVTYVQDLHFSPVAAAFTVSLLSGLSIAGRLGFGFLALRFNIKKITITFFIVQLIALGILLTSRNLGLLYVYSVLFGLSNGAIVSALPTMIGAYYGRAHFAQITGVILAVAITIEAIGPTIAGIIHDTTSTYTLHFIIVAAFNLAGLICVFFIRPPKLPNPSNQV